MGVKFSICTVVLLSVFVLGFNSPLHAGGGPGSVIPGRYIVVLHDSVSSPAVVARDMAARHGLIPQHIYSVAIKGFSAQIPASRLADVESDPSVDYVEPDLVVQAIKGKPPGTPGGGGGGEEPAPEQTVPTGIKRIGASIDGTVNADIAIIDTGVSSTHPDLNFYRGVTVTGSGKAGGEDDNGHGSHVAGSAAAIDNGIGVVGVAPGARIWSVKVLNRFGSGSIGGVIAGIDWLTQYASEIESANMSLSATGRSDSFRQALANSVAAGIFYAVAAGNGKRDVYGTDGKFNTGDDDTIPAAYPEVATVSALADSDGLRGGIGGKTSYGLDDTFATFSNYSKSVVANNPVSSPGGAIDLAAPGVDIYSTWKKAGYNTISGTSMAAPHLAGAAAAYIAVNGKPANGAGVAAVRQALIYGGFPQGGADGFKGDKDNNPEPLLNAGDL